MEKGDDEDNFLHARVPKNILKKLALLSVKLKMSVRQALIYTMAFYKLCGIDPGDVDLSLTSCFRYRRDEASAVAQDRLESVAAIVIQNSSKIFVPYDTKQIEEDIGGEKKLVERLAVVVSSPVLERDVLLCAFAFDSGTGEAMADAVYAILCSVELQDHVGGIVADTTASNFGPYRGSIVILQEYLGNKSVSYWYFKLTTTKKVFGYET